MRYWTLAAAMLLTPVAAAAQDDGFDHFVSAGRASALVDSAREGLRAMAEARPNSPDSDPWTVDKTYAIIYSAALELDLLRGQACDEGILRASNCRRMFRPAWLLPPRRGLYRRSQLDRFLNELMAEAELVSRPVCNAARARGLAEHCGQVE